MRSTDQHSPGMTFVLWMACLLGLCGIHRFYLGKPVTGLLYLFTLGFFGIGQVIDLVRLRTMVDNADRKLAGRREHLIATTERRALPLPARDPDEDLRLALTRAASTRGGQLSVTQAVMATGKDFRSVEGVLDEMARSGYVDIGNDSDSGVLVYRFAELT